MLSKSLIQFSVDGWDYVPSLYFGMRSNYSRGIGSNGDLLQKDLCQHTKAPGLLYSVPLSTHASAGDSWKLPGKSGSAFCGINATFSWVLVHTRFCLCTLRVCFPSPVEIL